MIIKIVKKILKFIFRNILKVDLQISKLGKKSNPDYGWFWGYNSFEEVKKESTGYDSQVILKKCSDALMKVKTGKAIYERDSVIFDKIQYSFPLLSFLLYIASQNNNNLKVIDFGGSLGSSYFQNKYFLDKLSSVKWYIVEQENFI